MTDGQTTAGFFGKLPSHGDFISRRLSPGFLKFWDEWLQNVVLCSQEQLGNGWLDAYLTSPIWRFALSPNLVSEQAWLGVLMPSVDRVGRYFPLTIAVPIGPAFTLMQVIEHADPWFERLDEIALSTLESDSDVNDLESRLAELGAPVSEAVAASPTRPGYQRQQKLALRAGVVSIDSFGAIVPALLTRILGATVRAYGLWWTRGSDRVTPSILVTEGLPPVQGFAAFLDGQWSRWGWDDDDVDLAAHSTEIGGRVSH